LAFFFAAFFFAAFFFSGFAASPSFFIVLSIAGAAFAGAAAGAAFSAAMTVPKHVRANTTATNNDRNLFIVLTSGK
jgi:hypothetical protein